MALRIRLRQQGRRNRQMYRLVVTDARSKRDGKYVEMLGWYDPHYHEEVNGAVKGERIKYWVSVGAQVSDRARQLIERLDRTILT